MVDIGKLLDFQSQAVINWHNDLILNHHALPWKFIEENHKWNFMLWHEEDIARVKDIDNLRIVTAKRNIDKYNQSRNDAIERTDEWILSYLQVRNVNNNEKMHSETPGMIIDRLSIMALKRYHMLEETTRVDTTEAHKTSCINKALILNEQITDLAKCLSILFEELETGKLKFKIYRQFKMYNNPDLNPELYRGRP